MIEDEIIEDTGLANVIRITCEYAEVCVKNDNYVGYCFNDREKECLHYRWKKKNDMSEV